MGLQLEEAMEASMGSTSGSAMDHWLDLKLWEEKSGLLSWAPKLAYWTASSMERTLAAMKAQGLALSGPLWERKWATLDTNDVSVKYPH
jgi:hypothetical protein